jgi:hypothetical protein
VASPPPSGRERGRAKTDQATRRAPPPASAIRGGGRGAPAPLEVRLRRRWNAGGASSPAGFGTKGPSGSEGTAEWPCWQGVRTRTSCLQHFISEPGGGQAARHVEQSSDPARARRGVGGTGCPARGSPAPGLGMRALVEPGEPPGPGRPRDDRQARGVTGPPPRGPSTRPGCAPGGVDAEVGRRSSNGVPHTRAAIVVQPLGANQVRATPPAPRRSAGRPPGLEGRRRRAPRSLGA